MTNIRNGVAVLESMWCDDRAWCDEYEFALDLDSSTGYMTGNSPNQGTARNLVFARPPATWTWGTLGDRKSVYEQMTPTHLMDGACYEMVEPNDPLLGDNARLGIRGWDPTGPSVGGNSGYTEGGWAVGHAGYQTIRIKEDGDYLFVINIPFESATGGRTTANPQVLSGNSTQNLLDLIRVQCEVFVNNALDSNGTYGTDFVTGGVPYYSVGPNIEVAASDALAGGLFEHNRNKYWANAQYTTMIRLSEGDLVNIRVRGLNETYNGPNGTSIQGGAPHNTRRTTHDVARFFSAITDPNNPSRWGEHPAKIYIERLEDKAAGGPSVFSTDSTKSITGGGALDSNFHPDSEQFLSWNAPDLQNNGRFDTESFSWSGANSRRITIDETGFYQIHLHYRYGQLDDDVDIDLGSVVRLYKNGGPLQVNGPAEVRPASATVLRRQTVPKYNDFGTGSPTNTRLDDRGTGNYTGIQRFEAGDYLEVSIQGEGTSYGTNDGKAEITLIKLEDGPGSFAKDTAIFHSGRPNSCLVKTNTGSSPGVLKSTTAWNHEGYMANDTVSGHYRVGTSWAVESIDTDAFEYLGTGRWRTKKPGFLLVSILHASEVNTSGVSNTDSTWDSGTGYGRAGSTTKFDHYSSSILNVGVEPSGTWPSGVPKKIENTSLAFGVQASLSHFASTRANAGTMHRTKMFSSSFNGTGLSALDYSVSGTPVPVPAGTEISTWTRGFGQAEKGVWSYSQPPDNFFVQYPGALEKEAAGDTQRSRLVLRLITPLVNASGALTSDTATVAGSGSSQGQITGSGDLSAGNATLDGGLSRLVTCPRALLASADATVSGEGGSGSLIAAALVAEPPTIAAILAFLRTDAPQPVDPGDLRADDAVLAGDLTRFVGIDANLSNTEVFDADIDRIVGGLGSLKSGPAATDNTAESVFDISANLQAAAPSFGSSLQQVIQRFGFTQSLVLNATLSADVKTIAGITGELAPVAPQITSSGNPVYRQAEGALSTTSPVLAGAGARALSFSASLTAGAAQILVSTELGVDLPPIALQAADAIAGGQLTRTTQGSGSIAPRTAAVFHDIDRIVDADAVSLAASTTTVAATLDVIRESANDTAVSLVAAAAVLSADIGRVSSTLGASLSAGLSVLLGASTKTAQLNRPGEILSGAATVGASGSVTGQINGALVASQIAFAGAGDVYREGESAILQAAPATLTAAGQVARPITASLQTAEVVAAGAVAVKRQLSGALASSAVQVQSEGQKVGAGSGAPVSERAALTVSASVLSVGSVTLTAGAAQVAGAGLRLAQGAGAFTNSAVLAASPQRISLGTSSFGVLTAATQGDGDVLREGENAILQASPATLFGELSVVGGASQVDLTAAAASLSASTQQAAQAAPSLQAAPAAVGTDLDIIRESDNGVAVTLTAAVARLTTTLSVIRDGESASLAASDAALAATTVIARGSVGPNALLAAAATTDGFITRAADKTVFGSLVAAAPQVDSSLSLAHQTLSAPLAASAVALAVSSTNVKQGAITLLAGAAVTSGGAQPEYGITGDLAPAAAFTTGSIQRYWETSAALAAASVSLTAVVGAVQPPTATYNLIVPSSRHVVFVSLD